MKYPVVSPSEGREALVNYREGKTPVLAITWTGEGDNMSLAAERAIKGKIIDIWKSSQAKRVSKSKQREDFEIAACRPFRDFINTLPVEVMMDPGYWTYLSMEYFLDIITWRHPGNSDLGNFGIIPTRLQESLLGRLYLRADLVQGTNLVEIEGQDLWRSHVLRVKIGNSPSMASAFLTSVSDLDLSLHVFRDLAKRLTALRSNVCYEVIDDEAAKFIVDFEVPKSIETVAKREALLLSENSGVLTTVVKNNKKAKS